jgi:arsenate reductase
MYHNPRCSKSRQTLALLEEKNIDVQIIEYLNDGLSKGEIENIINLLGESSLIVRIKEDEYKQNKFDINNSNEVIAALVKTPKLLERPIVIKDNQAVIGRPPKNVLNLL